MKQWFLFTIWGYASGESGRTDGCQSENTAQSATQGKELDKEKL